jgi:hypothetical protein
MGLNDYWVKILGHKVRQMARHLHQLNRPK